MNQTAIPAITVYQPYASMIALGLKRFEFRGWAPPRKFMCRTVAIHAAKKFAPKTTLKKMLDTYQGTAAIPVIEAALREDLPSGAVICTATIAAVLRVSGLVEPLTGKTLCGGGLAWRMDDVKAFPRPIPAKGAQGFWWWTQPAGPARSAVQVALIQDGGGK